ncbi:MAG: hypothetical protein ABJG41_14915 [Cyclobacteriaceae bacterium]
MVDQFNDKEEQHGISTITSGEEVDEALNRGAIGTGEQVQKMVNLGIDPESGEKKKKKDSVTDIIDKMNAWADQRLTEIDQEIAKTDTALDSIDQIRKLHKEGKLNKTNEEHIILFHNANIDVESIDNGNLDSELNKWEVIHKKNKSDLIDERDNINSFKKGLNIDPNSSEARQQINDNLSEFISNSAQYADSSETQKSIYEEAGMSQEEIEILAAGDDLFGGETDLFSNTTDKGLESDGSDELEYLQKNPDQCLLNEVKKDFEELKTGLETYQENFKNLDQSRGSFANEAEGPAIHSLNVTDIFNEAVVSTDFTNTKDLEVKSIEPSKGFEIS